MRKIDVKDVDGTVPGKAALVMINLDDPWNEKADPSLVRSDFDEEYAPDPIRACWELWASIKGDWPGHTAAVIANDRAKYLDWDRKMRAIGFTDNDPAKYVETMSS